MKKLFYQITIALSLLSFYQSTYAVDLEEDIISENTIENSLESQEIQSIIESYNFPKEDSLYVNELLTYDIGSLQELLSREFPEIPFEFQWDIFTQSQQTGTVIQTAFETPGNKSIQLNIYKNEADSQSLVYTTNLDIFIYEKSFPLLVSSSLTTTNVNEFINDAKEMGTYINIIGEYSEASLNGAEIVQNLDAYLKNNLNTSDYIVVWGEKEFLFSSLSQIHNSVGSDRKLNFVLVSGYNTSILKNYIGNNISGKDFIDTAFILDNTLLFQILKNPIEIRRLQLEVENNSYSYTELGQNITIPPVLFVSQFVNKLSNMGISTSDIYIILLLPIFLTCIGIAKHMIGISTLGSIIPIFITLLYIKMGIIFVLGILFFLLVINISISKFTGKYTLLYTPKVSFITIVNIFAFMIIYNILSSYDIVNFRIDNILYVALFFIVAEKLITIITSKEFREYKKSISGTVIVSLVCLMIYYADTFRVFIVAYPEILLLFIPINFFLGRFTGLRVTEYLRFREIIKGTEE